jgi:hypothetical protein
MKHCLFPLYLPTQQNAPTQHILFAKNICFHFAPKKRTFCPILLHLHTHFVKKKIRCVTYLPTRYPQGPVGKGETNTCVSYSQALCTVHRYIKQLCMCMLCLAQVTDQGEEKPIYCLAHQSSFTQTSWSTIKKEGFVFTLFYTNVIIICIVFSSTLVGMGLFSMRLDIFDLLVLCFGEYIFTGVFFNFL